MNLLYRCSVKLVYLRCETNPFDRILTPMLVGLVTGYVFVSRFIRYIPATKNTGTDTVCVMLLVNYRAIREAKEMPLQNYGNYIISYWNFHWLHSHNIR